MWILGLKGLRVSESISLFVGDPYGLLLLYLPCGKQYIATPFASNGKAGPLVIF